MKRFIAAVVVLFMVALFGGLVAQEPPGADEPVRLKKKKKPAQEEPTDLEKPIKKKEKKTPEREKDKENATPESDSVDEGADEREVLERIARNVKLAEERLANRELGDATRQVQEDVLKDIDSLIKKASQPDQGGGGGDSSQDQNQDQGQDQKQGEKQGQKKGQSGQGQSAPGQTGKGNPSGKSSSRSSAGKRSGSRGGSKSSQGGKHEKGPGQKSHGKGGKPSGDGRKGTQGKSNSKNKGGNMPPGQGGRMEDGPLNRAADLYKDVWGHLPESLRSEMNAYFNDKQFMPKYDDLIKRYYSAIAEKGRSKER